MVDSIQVEDNKVEVSNAQEATTTPTTERKRPRLNLGAMLGGDRKRGRGMLGLALGTLNKAKVEDKERNASEAAKKRQLIERRLQMKLKKETDSVRRAEEAKKDKTLANRKEEDLQLKDSIYKLRRKRLPVLAHFLLTSDDISSDDSTPPLSGAPRSHPPPLYYLPAILTSAQESFLNKRKAEVAEAAQQEWEAFKKEREAGIQEINNLRQKVVDEEARSKAERETGDTDALMDDDDAPRDDQPKAQSPAPPSASMEVDDGAKPSEAEPARTTSQGSDKKDDVAPMQDDDDAVEY